MKQSIQDYFFVLNLLIINHINYLQMTLEFFLPSKERRNYIYLRVKNSPPKKVTIHLELPLRYPQKIGTRKNKDLPIFIKKSINFLIINWIALRFILLKTLIKKMQKLKPIVIEHQLEKSLKYVVIKKLTCPKLLFCFICNNILIADKSLSVTLPINAIKYFITSQKDMRVMF